MAKTLKTLFLALAMINYHFSCMDAAKPELKIPKIRLVPTTQNLSVEVTLGLFSDRAATTVLS
jgi:hypothetical protein